MDLERSNNHEEIEDKHQPAAGNLMDSKTSNLDDRLIELLEDAVHKNTLQVHEHDIAKITCQYSPIDLAHVVSRLPISERPVVYRHILDEKDKVSFLINTDRNTRVAVFRNSTNKEIKDLVSIMPLDEAAWILDDLPNKRERRILTLLPLEKVEQINEVREHDPHTAGRLMSSEFFSFHMETTIKEALKLIRERPGIDLMRQIFIVDPKGVLLGCVPVRNLVVNKSSLPLKQVMQPVLHTVTPDSMREEVADLVERYKIPTLPVIDANNVLQGVISYEDVIEMMEDIADDAIARMAGTVAEDVEAYDPTWKRILARMPWLTITLFGGLINAANIRYFESIFHSIIVLFFVPLVAGMSGNVGIQCSTVLIRGMATGQVSAGNRRRVVFREFQIGLANGLCFGLLGGGIVYLVNLLGIYQFGPNPAIEIGTIVAVGLISSCLTATILGVSMPLFFARIGVDPAIAAGPIITAINDVFSTIIYFVIVYLVTTMFFV